MTTLFRSHWLRALLALALLTIALLGRPQAAKADWVIQGDTIPAGQVIDNDVIIYGPNIRIDGTVKGDVVAVGSSVTVNGQVAGSLVAVGRVVSIDGDVGGSVYVVARTLKMGSSAFVHNNVHFGGLLLDTQRGSRIGRDLVAAAVRASVGSEIGRGLNAIIALFSFDGKIGYGLDAAPSGARAPEGELASILLFVGRGEQKLAGYASPLRSTFFQDEAGGSETLLPEWLVARAGEFVTLLLLGALALWLFPQWFRRGVDSLRARPLPALGWGALALIIFVNGLGIALLLSAMLVAVGIWLGNVTLWNLAFLFWGVGFGLMVLFFSLLALAVFFGSKIVVFYTLARLALKRLAPRVAEYRFAVLLLGLILYVLLRSIPTIGWVIEILVIVFGVGAIWLALRHKEPSAPLPSHIIEGGVQQHD